MLPNLSLHGAHFASLLNFHILILVIFTSIQHFSRRCSTRKLTNWEVQIQRCPGKLGTNLHLKMMTFRNQWELTYFQIRGFGQRPSHSLFSKPLSKTIWKIRKWSSESKVSAWRFLKILAAFCSWALEPMRFNFSLLFLLYSQSLAWSSSLYNWWTLLNQLVSATSQPVINFGCWDWIETIDGDETFLKQRRATARKSM